jgi:pyridoxine 5-phosphate synthase
MFRLGVNIDHVATIRNARGGIEPEPVLAAGIVQKAGADSVVMHLREDRRHVRDKDIFLVKKNINIKLNLEMAISDDIVQQALEVVPAQATLVPEKREELTTEGGLDVKKFISPLKDIISEMKKKGIIVSLFIEADKEQIEMSRKVGAQMIEIHTGHYANLFMNNRYDQELEKIKQGVIYAKEIGLEVACGHGLTLQNLPLIASIMDIEEFNIGHNIISSAVFVGLERAIRDTQNTIQMNRI